jgi:hypothetical protein
MLWRHLPGSVLELPRRVGQYGSEAAVSNETEKISSDG